MRAVATVPDLVEVAGADSEAISGTDRGVGRALHQAVGLAFAVLLLLLAFAVPAKALKPIVLSEEQARLDIARLGEHYHGRGDNLQIETAAGPDGATGRMSVGAATPGTNPQWVVFALHNPTNKTLEFWLTADRYNVIGSGLMWPDLDARRLEAISHSAGFVPDRIHNNGIDIYRLTIERGQTVTYVVELASDRVSRLELWKPIEFEQRQRERQLFNGIMLGITGLLAVFLTAVFAANHKAIFPSAALVSWCVLALLCVDFGFWHKLFQMKPEDNAQYRAAAEAAVAASLVIFLWAFLRVSLWHGFVRTLFAVWIVSQLAIVATAVLDPRLAATVARMSLVAIGIIGLLPILFLSMRQMDRALALLPTWLLFLVWLFAAGVTITGRLNGEFAIYGLIAGLVLIMLMIGFTVMQFAFRSGEPAYGTLVSQQNMRLLAMERSALSFWEWSARRNEIKVDPEVEAMLGLGGGELPNRVEDFVTFLHPADKERLQTALAEIRERRSGSLRMDIRLRHTDSSYRWLEMEGTTVPGQDRRTLRCVGLMRDVTDERRAQERLMLNAVHDSLTSLPNRELFLDRLSVAMLRAQAGTGPRPTVILFDIDKFKSVNSSFGLIVGDSILLTIARRLTRSLKVDDTLARVAGDQFALLIAGNRDGRDVGRVAEHMRLSLRSPIRIAGEEIVLTSSVGIALDDGEVETARELLREAEIAMQAAKRQGTDRVDIFKPAMRADKDARIAVESDLRRAIELKQLKLLYQPIIALSNEELVGFEALVRWEHPKLGLLSPADFVPIAEETDLILQLGSYVLSRALIDLARWQKELPRPEQPLFVSINVSSRQLIKPDLVQEIRHAIGRAVVPASSVRLEITESLVMENPEQATHILSLIKDAGVGLSLDDFGTGYSSLAYMHRFPFDTIKVDKALVQASSEGDSIGAILRSIVALAGELGKRIVAEGVETADDATFLRSIGCHYAQGFYYGEPVGETEVSRFLKLVRKSDQRMRRRGIVRGRDKERRKAGDAVTELRALPVETVDASPAQPSRPTAASGDVPYSQPFSQPYSQPYSQPINPPQAASPQPPASRGPAPQSQPLAARIDTGGTMAPPADVGRRPPPAAPPMVASPTAPRADTRPPAPVQAPDPARSVTQQSRPAPSIPPPHSGEMTTPSRRAPAANGTPPPVPALAASRPAPPAGYADRTGPPVLPSAVGASSRGESRPPPLNPETTHSAAMPPRGEPPIVRGAPPAVPPMPQAAPASAATPRPEAMDGRLGMNPMRRRADLDTLPPAIAASLAKLAGTRSATREGEPRERPNAADAKQVADDRKSPTVPSKSDAAE